MRAGRLPERSGRAALAALALALAGCAERPRVSPWGPGGRPRLAAYAERPDLARHLEEVATEARRLGLSEVARVSANDPRSGEPLVALGLEGVDGVGRRLTATRIVSPWGVVLARGPHDLADVRRRAATTLVGGRADEAQGAAEAEEPAPLSDVTGDGGPDVLLRSDQGRLEVWSVTSRGSTEVVVRLDVPPTDARDVDGDGRLDLTGEVAVAPDDPIGPRLVDVATFEGGAFSHGSAAARAFHARRRDLARVALSSARGEPERLRRALEVAWHAILAGDDRDAELARLLAIRPSPELERPFHDLTRRVGRVGR